MLITPTGMAYDGLTTKDMVLVNFEGNWDEVMAAVKHCHEVVHDMGAPRITTSMRLGTRTDREQTMDDKIQSVQEKLN